MDKILAQIPLVSWTSVVALAFCGLLYLFSRVRKQDMTTLRDANVDLRASLNDQKDQIDAKGKEIDLLKTHIISMEKRIDDLEKRNKTLEEVVKLALKEYFEEHPKMAAQFQKQVEIL